MPGRHHPGGTVKGVVYLMELKAVHIKGAAQLMWESVSKHLMLINSGLL
jgi:hypothetical protein